MKRQRRGAGEGWISNKRPDGRFEARLSLGWRDGKRISRSYFGKTRAAVQDQLARALVERQQGVMTLGQPDQTVEAFLTRWLGDVVAKANRPGTHLRYEHIVRLHIIPAVGKVRLTKLTPQHCQLMLSPLTPPTARAARAVLRAALSRAQKWGLVARNVAALSDCPPMTRREPHFLTQDQARAFLASAGGHDLEALYVVLVMLGLRIGEALDLRWQDVDFERRELHVRHTLQRVKAAGESNSKLRLLPTKTRGSERTLTMPRIVIDALRQHRAAQGLMLPTSHVFGNAGRPMDDDRPRDELHRLLAKAGLPPMRLHDLRHSCASFLLAAGVPARMVMETLGHSGIAVTMDLYTHVLPSLKQQAADAMDALLPRA